MTEIDINEEANRKLAGEAFGVTSTPDNEPEEDDNAYYRDQKIAESNKPYSPGPGNSGNGNGKSKGIATKQDTKPRKSKSELEQERQQKEEKEYEERIAAIAKNISSFEEWQATLSQKYNNLYNVVQTQLPNLWHSLEFDLSIKNILHIKDCTLPFAGIVLGKPSSLKTVGIEMFRKSRHTFYTDKFTSKSFVSHSTGIPKEQLIEVDLLPKIKNKCFLTPELAPIFAARDEDLIEILGTLTRVLDGHGYESDSGAHGHRGYNERMMFTWIGAAVDIPFKVHKLLTTLGPKLYFLRVPKVEQKSDDNYYQQLQHNDFDTKLSEIQQVLTEYQDWFEACPSMVHDDKFNSSIKKISWFSSSSDGNDNNESQKIAYMHIIKLGKLLAYLRGVVPTWHTQDTQGSEYGYGLPIIEEPDRAMQQLANLAKGHALLTGRNYVATDDIPMIVKVVLSTAPMERVTIFDILLASKGTLNVNQITSFLNVSEPTARRTMTELKALGLVEMKTDSFLCDDEIVRKGLVITLKPEFEWFLSDEFKNLRQGFKPEASSSNNDKLEEDSTRTKDHDVKEKYPPPTVSVGLTATASHEDNRVYGGENSFTSSNIDIEQSSPEQEQPYFCCYCSHCETTDKEELQRHVQSEHPGKPVITSFKAVKTQKTLD